LIFNLDAPISAVPCRAGWASHAGRLPIVEGTLINIKVDRLPGDRTPKPVCLWHSHTEADQLDLQRVFRIFLRRFNIEHTFRFLKQTLGWTRPRLRCQYCPRRIHSGGPGVSRKREPGTRRTTFSRGSGRILVHVGVTGL
jgi:hypothetical protein